jgi:hypothetical protein
VDFDVKQEPKSGYKININKDGNKFYNKEVVKETVLKRKHKEREKKKQSFVKNVPSL